MHSWVMVISFLNIVLHYVGSFISLLSCLRFRGVKPPLTIRALVISHLFIVVCEHGGAPRYHLVHDLCHTDHLVLVVEYRHAEYAGRVVAGLLVDYLVEPRILLKCSDTTIKTSTEPNVEREVNPTKK